MESVVKNTFLTRLESVQAELRAIAELIPEMDHFLSKNNYEETLPDVTIARTCDVTHFHFRLDPLHYATYLKIHFISRSIGDNSPDIDYGDF